MGNNSPTPYESGLDEFVRALVNDFSGMEAVDGLSREAIEAVLIGLGVPKSMRGKYAGPQIVKVAVRLTAEFTMVKEFEVEIDGEVDSDSVESAVYDLYLDPEDILRDEIWDADLNTSDHEVEDFSTDREASLI